MIIKVSATGDRDWVLTARASFGTSMIVSVFQRELLKFCKICKRVSEEQKGSMAQAFSLLGCRRGNLLHDG